MQSSLHACISLLLPWRLEALNMNWSWCSGTDGSWSVWDGVWKWIMCEVRPTHL